MFRGQPLEVTEDAPGTVPVFFEKLAATPLIAKTVRRQQQHIVVADERFDPAARLRCLDLQGHDEFKHPQTVRSPVEQVAHQQKPGFTPRPVPVGDQACTGQEAQQGVFVAMNVADNVGRRSHTFQFMKTRTVTPLKGTLLGSMALETLYRIVS